MVNKQGLWFLTLTSLALVLSVYYITMPNELLLTNNGVGLENTVNEVKEEKELVEITNYVEVGGKDGKEKEN